MWITLQQLGTSLATDNCDYIMRTHTDNEHVSPTPICVIKRRPVLFTHVCYFRLHDTCTRRVTLKTHTHTHKKKHCSESEYPVTSEIYDS